MNKKEIKNSISYKYYHRLAVVFTTILSLFLIAQVLVMIIPPILHKLKLLNMDEIDFNLSFLFLIILLAPFSIYYIYKCVVIKKIFTKCTFIDVRLDNPKYGEFNKNKVHFEIKIEEQIKTTPKIFSKTSSLFSLYFDDYFNRNITIGYLKEKEEVILIK